MIRTAVLLAVACSAILFRLPFCTDHLLTSDAADYLRSVHSGPGSLYLASGSVSFVKFVHLYRDKTVGPHLWDYLYRRQDASALLHFHVPAGFYADAAVGRIAPSNSTYRLIAALAGVLACTVLAAALLWIGAPPVLALATGVFAASAPPFVFTTVDFSPHGWYILSALCFLMAGAAAVRTKRAEWAWIAVVLLGVAIATLEFAPALVVSAAGALFLLRGWITKWRISLIQWLAGAGLLFLTCFAAWPGGILRGGYLKSYGVFLAQALVKRDDTFGPLRAGAVYSRLFGGDPVLLAAVAVSAGWLLWTGIRCLDRAEGVWIAFYTLVAFLLSLGNRFANETYVSEVLFFAVACCGVAAHYWLHSRPADSRKWVLSGLMLIAAVGVLKNLDTLRHRHSGDPELEQAVAALPAHVPSGAVIAVNRFGETYDAYLPQYHFEPTASGSTLKLRSTAEYKDPRYLLLDTRVLNRQSLRELAEGYTRLACFSARGGAGISLLIRTGSGSAPLPKVPSPSGTPERALP